MHGELLTSLLRLHAKWAIVTSGTKPLVAGWLKVLDLITPECMVTPEDVQKGKPDPECYRLGAKRLGLEIGGGDAGSGGGSKVLVLEDAPAGVKAGKAAGCMVLALATTHRLQELKDAGADWVVPDMRSVSILRDKEAMDGLEVRITNLLA